MLPSAFQIPATIALVLGGALACFAGYRLFKFVLAIYGFIFGAMIASSMMGVSNTAGMLIAALVGGLAGAAVLVLAYFVGIALVGAGLGALVVHLVWQTIRTGDPPVVAVIVLAVLGAIGAMLLQRYVIVVATAFGGAWTLIAGTLVMAGDQRIARAASAGDVWIFYPTSGFVGRPWLPVVWVLLGAIATAVQLGVTARKQ